jgi:uncharacterized protein
MPRISVQNHSHPLQQPIQVKYCQSFFDRLQGLMFRSPIALDDGALLDGKRESRVDAAIHMFFVSFDLGVIWLDDRMQVVDTCLAKSWRPFYMPVKAARYVLEIHPDRLLEFSKGDRIQFEGLARA